AGVTTRRAQQALPLDAQFVGVGRRYFDDHRLDIQLRAALVEIVDHGAQVAVDRLVGGNDQRVGGGVSLDDAARGGLLVGRERCRDRVAAATTAAAKAGARAGAAAITAAAGAAAPELPTLRARGLRIAAAAARNATGAASRAGLVRTGEAAVGG